MVKRLLLLTIILLLSQITVVFSQISIGTVDPGPYTPGSSIAAAFSIGTGCISANNTFELYLSDATGSFATETRIGTYPGFYGAFVNGIIPAGTPAGTNYSVRVKSTNPVHVSDPSPSFAITTGTPAVTAKLTSMSTISAPGAVPVTFGACDTDPSQTSTSFVLKNESSSGNVTVTIINELDGGAPSTMTFSSINEAKVFAASLAHYTMIVKATENGTVGTMAYFLVNNLAVTAFTTTSGNTVCFPVGAFEYLVNTGRNGGIKANFPGNTYSITWGDGSTDVYTYCEIVAKNSKVTHTFTKSSCGLIYTSGTETTYNAFGINVGVVSPFCGKVGSPLSTAAKVVSRPQNLFTVPNLACLGDVTFINTSTAGQKANANSPDCVPNEVLYTWNIDGVDVATNIPYGNYTYNFTTTGQHTIRLTSLSTGPCQADPIEITICVQKRPEPSFTLPNNPICINPGTLTPTNTSVLDNTCPAVVPIHTWTVTGPAPVGYLGGTNANSPTPQFKFTQIGRYRISLNIKSATCEATSTVQEVIVDGDPTADLSPEAKLCQIGPLTFDPNATITKTVISGSVDNPTPLTDTYTWEIIGTGAYNFVGPSTPNTKYPTINFADYGTYTVKLTFKNSCNTITRTQVINFYQSPVPSITAIPNPICYNANINLQGSIANSTAQTTFQWIGGPGGTFSDPLSLTTTYIPTVAERNAGVARIRLVVNTGLAGACAQVEDAINVTITPNNTSTNPIPTRTQTICTGNIATFTPSSVVTGSTFSWTAANADGNASGFSTIGSGNINEAITNTDATQNAVVIYTITPVTPQCTGVPFTFTVTVTPRPIISTPVLSKTICHGNSAAIVITSNISTQFTWTSVPSAGITGNSNQPTLSAASNTITIPDVLLNSTFQPGTVTYTIKPYSSSSTGCEGNTITVVVTVDPAVTQANAGLDESICSNTTSTSTYTLKGNNPNVGTGLWKLISTHAVPPVIAVPTDFETTVSGLITGQSYTFEWAITGACASTNDQVTITVTPKPVISAPVLDKTICQNNSAGITVNSDIPTQFTWTSQASAGITGNSNPAALSTPSNSITINDVLLNSTFSQGTVTYTIKSYSAENCEGNTIIIVVKVDPAVTIANAGPDVSICNTTTYNLKGNKPDVGSGLWELVSASTGTPAIAIPTDFETNVTGLVAGGIYTFKWTITGTGECAKSEDQVTITVNIPTIPGTTAGQQIVCQNSNSGVITLSGNTGSILAWQMLPDTETVWQDIPGINTTATYTFNNLNVTTQFRAVVQNSGCAIDYSTPTTITVAPATTIANAGVNQILCNELSFLLKGNPILPGETGVWSQVSGGPNTIITPAANSEATVTGITSGITYIFKWTITGNSPCDPTTDNVTIRNNAAIDLNTITTSNVVCNGQRITIDGSIPNGGAENGLYNYIWESKIGAGPWTVLTGETNEDLIITLTTTGIVSFRRIVNSGTCTSTSNEFPVTVQPPIGNNSITADQAVCTNEIPLALTGTVPSGGGGNFNYDWEFSIDGGISWNSTNTLQPDFQPTLLNRTTQYRRVVSTVTCNGAQKHISNVITITLKPDAIAKFTYTKDKDCAPFQITALNVIAEDHPTENATYTWFAGSTQIGTGVNFPGHTITNSNEQVIIKLVVTPKIGCNPAEFSWSFSTNQAVPASFDISETSICAPKQVVFTNTSLQGAGATFKWKVGNTQISTSANPPPYTFQPDPTGKDTTYTVTLYSQTICGIDSAKGTVLVRAKPIAIFSPGTTTGCSPLPVIFTNNAPNQSGVEYFYDYGDDSNSGWVSNRNDVTHTYLATTKIETYHVKMTARGECGTDVSRIYDIVVSPKTVKAELVVSGTQKAGCAPFTVDFDNNSTGATQFLIDFKDGFGPRPLAASPKIFQYEFKEGGVYDVMLIAKNDCSADTTYEKITVHAQPKPMFEADLTLGCPNLPVTFTNTTQGNDITSYLWDFGDGSTPFPGFEPPTHVFTGDQEYYTVTLTATNALGCPNTQTLRIHIVQPPQAAFTVNPSTLISIPDYTFNFKDESTNNPTIWHWDFGDGVTSASRNPSHTYLDTGTYNVTLRVENQQGCFTTTPKKVTIKGVPGYLFVPNSFIPGSEIPELRLFRAKGSGIQAWRFSIFNKWGQILWETTKLDEGRPSEGWDGTYKGQALPQGVYYWKIDVQMVNGTEWKGMTYDKSPPKRTGAINLIR